MGRLYANKEFYEISDMTEEAIVDQESYEHESQRSNSSNLQHVDTYIQTIVNYHNLVVSTLALPLLS